MFVCACVCVCVCLFVRGRVFSFFSRGGSGVRVRFFSFRLCSACVQAINLSLVRSVCVGL